MSTASAALLAVVRAHFGAEPPASVGVAVSGGSDSLGLLHLLNDWRKDGGPTLRVATVDHGLRPEATAEAAMVAQVCAALNVAHATLRWDGAAATGNLPDQARRARYGLLADWARDHGIADLAVGHTEDDVAETFVMRLARGAGVDGLSAMRARWQAHGITFHRPMLALRRAALRDMLRARGADWAEDPTNSDPAYLRARARAALTALAPLGLGTAMLATTARHLSEARTALAAYARREAATLTTLDRGDLRWHRDGFAALPDEIARRLLRAGLIWTAGPAYAPRGATMTACLAAARAGARMTVQGCVLSASKSHIRLSREYRAVAGLRVPVDALWDGRWRAQAAPTPIAGAEIGALGETGLRACPNWRDGGLPRASAMASPGIWQGDRLIAAPLAGWPNGWRMDLARDMSDYADLLVFH